MGRTWSWLEPGLNSLSAWKRVLGQCCCSCSSCWSSKGWHWDAWPRQAGCYDSWMPWWRWQGGSGWFLAEHMWLSEWIQSAPFLTPLRVRLILSPVCKITFLNSHTSIYISASIFRLIHFLYIQINGSDINSSIKTTYL